MNPDKITQVIETKVHSAIPKLPFKLNNLVAYLMNKLLHVDEVIAELKRGQNLKNFEMIDEIFESLKFSYSLTHKDKLKIPAEGKLIIVSNHPLGGLDGLALLRSIGEIRSDVKIVANDVLLNLENLSDLFLPFDVFNRRTQLNSIVNIQKAIQRDEAVIFFPAGEVSRLSLQGIKDGKWTKGAVKLAQKLNTPILPVYTKARNSILFYIISLLKKSFSTLLLPHELFSKRNTNIAIKIGDPIPADVFSSKILSPRELTNLLKKHVYTLPKKKKKIFRTEKNIIHPVDSKKIYQELRESKLLGHTFDGKRIYLVDAPQAENVMKEISRLREITFRKVGEGTGKKSDIDRYDAFYKHIVLWDDNNLDIVGSYRIGITSEIIEKFGKEGLYNAEQFKLNPIFDESLTCSIELGRSFVQEKYWRSNALDYLWQGIGALLIEYPDIRYLFGAVSISNSYTEKAKSLIVYYYKKWYDSDKNYAKAINEYHLTSKLEEEAEQLLNADFIEQDFRTLRTALKNYGFTIPVLLRRYVDICEYGGVKFIGFGVDKNFSDSIDCLIQLDLHKIKKEKKERYIDRNFLKTTKNIAFEKNVN